jgi:hypothetical protein
LIHGSDQKRCSAPAQQKILPSALTAIYNGSLLPRIMNTQRQIFPAIHTRIISAGKITGKFRGKKLSGHHSGLIFSAGEPVRQSGIYEVIHDQQHREAHEAVMLHDTPFPYCDTCKDRVRFRLIRTAPYIFHDQDFEEQK